MSSAADTSFENIDSPRRPKLRTLPGLAKIIDGGIRHSWRSPAGKHPGAPRLELSDVCLYPNYLGEKQGNRHSAIKNINKEIPVWQVVT
jgi:hypothetical protein